MKRVLVYFAAVLVMASCSKPVQEDEVNYVKVGLSVAGEISVSESPLTKASGNDLYGFNVYKSTNGGTSYTAYAFGLYDDVSNVTIELPDDGVYKFECRMIKEGKTTVDHYSHDGTFAVPFWINGYGFVAIGNSFTISSSSMVLTWGVKTVSPSGTFDRAPVDSYYGVATGFDPAVATNVSIDMKRTVFGVKVVVENLDTGSLHVDISGAPRMTIVAPSTEIQQILTLAGTANIPGNTDFSETVTCRFIWQKDEDTQIEISTQDITFKRNTLTTINITIDPQTVNASLGLNVEATDLQAGSTVNIGGSGSGTGTNVNV